jgi:hypothetical protein
VAPFSAPNRQCCWVRAQRSSRPRTCLRLHKQLREHILSIVFSPYSRICITSTIETRLARPGIPARNNYIVEFENQTFRLSDRDRKSLCILVALLLLKSAAPAQTRVGFSDRPRLALSHGGRPARSADFSLTHRALATIYSGYYPRFPFWLISHISATLMLLGGNQIHRPTHERNE